MFDIYNIFIQLNGMDKMLDELAVVEENLKEIIMTTKQDVLDAVAVEAGEVAAGIAALQVQIDALIAAGTGATSQDLEDIKVAIQAIFTPVP